MDRPVKGSMAQSLSIAHQRVCRLSCLVMLLPAVLLALPAPSRTKPVFTEEQLNKVDEFIKNIITCRPTPGLVVSIVRGDSTFSRAYGKADVHKDTNATTDSIFCLASLTKAFTATILAEILPQHYPDTVWDTRVKDILGESFRFVDDVRTELTTVKDLMSHRTGLMRGDLGIYGGYPGTVTRRQMAHRLYHLKARYGFRDKMWYSNWMYMLAGYIAEELSGGESWESLVSRKLLKPLGMTSTVLLGELGQYVNTTLAVPYRVVDNNFHPFPLEHYSFHPEQPAASLCSTGNDMIRWMQFLLNIKTFGVTPPNLANTSAFQATMMPHMIVENRHESEPRLPGNPHFCGAGFGWVIGGYRGQRMVTHSGALLASYSMLWLIPDKNIGLFLASNRQARDPFLSLIGYYITDVLSGHEPWINHTTACTFPEPWKERSPPSDYKHTTHTAKRPLIEYTGTYGNKLFGEFDVILVNEPMERLEIRYGKHFEGVLIPSATTDTFSVNLTGVYWFLTHKSPILDALSFMESEDGSLRCLTFFMQSEMIEFYKNVRFNGWRSSRSYSFCPDKLLLLFVLGLTFITTDVWLIRGSF